MESHDGLAEVAMHGLSEGLLPTNEDVICEAAIKWCARTHLEPDERLISLAVDLFNRGHNTSERLLKALEKDLMN
jgi:hypothetical protein